MVHATRGIRARLTVTLVALVALTAILLGAGAYIFVAQSLHDQALRDAATQARFDLSVTVPEAALPDVPTTDDITASRLLDAFHQRAIGAIVDLGPNGEAVSESDLPGVLATLPTDLRQRVAGGELAFAWTTVAGRPRLIVGGRVGSSGPALYFVRDVSLIEDGLTQLRLALVVGAIILILLALLAARVIARGVLAPVEAASRAAERIERGDLSARVPVSSNDEFGTWAERFNRMAEALADTIGRLEDAEAQNRRFVADVAHELRTPVAALVAEASILRDHLDALPAASRRAGELLVSDVGRLRALVEELMEVSRFDAHAERIALEPTDLGRLVATVTAARLPEATLSLPPDRLVVDTDPRRLERILGNLLDNAREHAPDAPVEVTLAAEGHEIVLAVADRGPGVPADQLGRLFERFYKADASRHGGSSGLGLAIAAEHAALLGGTLTAAPRTGGGLRIELRLPVTGSLPRSDATETDGAEASEATFRQLEPKP
ncbi:MAG: two-component system, OmpR family, sensor histidine kinase MtrB [Chloroflexota bacterium]|nr:two-component system, OmpR family, sensor histidine kinase MtrB [Chloroflexota bacterium]